MELKCRELKAGDIFLVSAVVKKLRLDLKSILSQVMKINSKNAIIRAKEELTTEDQEEINENNMVILGLIINELFANIYLAENEIKALFAKVTNKTTKEIDKLSAKDFMLLSKEVITNSGFMDLLV